MAASGKHYVVWEGYKPGVYATWADCQKQTKGYTNAKFKSFPNKQSAKKAYREGPAKYWGTGKFVSALSKAELTKIGNPVKKSLCVDAAWNSETKVVEYRGVWYGNRNVVFQQGPFPGGTNNVGEFLAIVHALGVLSKKKLNHPVYSDSQSAIKWVKQKKVNSTKKRSASK